MNFYNAVTIINDIIYILLLIVLINTEILYSAGIITNHEDDMIRLSLLIACSISRLPIVNIGLFPGLHP